MAHDTRQQLRKVLAEAGLLEDAAFADRNMHAWPLVKAALAAGLYPNLVRVDAGGKRARFFARDHGLVKLHPGSVNGDDRPGAVPWSRRWLIYSDKVRTLALALTPRP